jgi:hypothetical protein
MTIPRARAIAVIYTITIFLSASLLFFVQPLFAKMVLPHLGGAAAVWTTAMLFFQTVLLGGYAYAHFVAMRLSIRTQIGVQATVWMCGLLLLPIAVPASWAYEPNSSPALQTLTVFALGVGLPFFTLAANAPLLQKWYARGGGPSAHNPYHLYAASNAGSLMALLAYPLLAEPILGTRDISLLWAGGYVALGLGLALCAHLALRGGHAEKTLVNSAPAYRPNLTRVLTWVGLAFVPSSMMLGVTSFISSELGAFPLVWVIPLALYLLTFVIAFSDRLRPPRRVVTTIFLVTVIAVIVLMVLGRLPEAGRVGFITLILAFFSVTLLSHMNLYDSRPPEAGLTAFYFAMACGGALGGVFSSIAAPNLFDSTLETPIIFAVAGLVMGGLWRPLRDIMEAGVAVGLVGGLALLFASSGLTPAASTEFFLVAGSLSALALLIARDRPLRFALTSAGFLLVGSYDYWNDSVTYRARSFFGAYVVRDTIDGGRRMLVHGSTVHGVEFVADLGTRPRILGYYHPNAPLGQILRSGAIGPRARIGVVGLGVGALSCYSRPGQSWRFYEIDGLIDRIARDPALFSYMEHCAGDTPTILGDARLTLAHESGAPFDLLVIDAYSSDAIPIHLMTVEALALYRSRLAPNGLLALHTSSRYYKLAPLLANAASVLGLRTLIQTRLGTADDPIVLGESPSEVVLMSRDSKALEEFANDSRWRELKPNGERIWTDDHANLLAAF